MFNHIDVISRYWTTLAILLRPPVKPELRRRLKLKTKRAGGPARPFKPDNKKTADGRFLGSNEEKNAKSPIPLSATNTLAKPEHLLIGFREQASARNNAFELFAIIF